jgi:hypothetical protein
MLGWINFLFITENGRVTLAYAYELGDTRVPRCDPHGGVSSPLPRPLQQSDQACSAHELKGMHNLSSRVMIMSRSTKTSSNIHEAECDSLRKRHRWLIIVITQLPSPPTLIASFTRQEWSYVTFLG